MPVFAETVLCVALAAGHKQQLESRAVMFASNKPSFHLMGGEQPIIQANAPVFMEAIRRDLCTIPEVRGVKFEKNGAEYMVSISVHQPSRDVRYRIYDKQDAIIRAFSEHLFDFRLIEDVYVDAN